MSKVKLAKSVLFKARDQMIEEIASCGSHGGVGRAGSYVPTFVNLMKSIEYLEELEREEADVAAGVKTQEQVVADRMAAVRAAKNKQ